ncbi:MAG: YitT family protein [Breznakibacter sp.]
MLKKIPKKWIQTFESYLIITFALVISAIGWVGFLIKSKIVAGGLMGLSTLVFMYTGLPVGPVNFIMNVVLILFAMKILGRGFGFKTVYSLALLSFLVYILQVYIDAPIVPDKFMAAIIGGSLIGFSIGMLLTQGGSTGGTEIVAMVVNKYRNVSPGRVMMVCDIIIIGSSYLYFRDIEALVYGYVVMGLMSGLADMVLTGSKQSVQIFIVSKKTGELAEAIASEVTRGMSILNGRGFYTQEEREFIIMIVRKTEMHEVLHIVKQTDQEAFISVANVMGVYGKGFDQYRPPIKSPLNQLKDKAGN